MNEVNEDVFPIDPWRFSNVIVFLLAGFDRLLGVARSVVL